MHNHFKPLYHAKCIKKFDIASSVRGTSQLWGAIPLYCQVPKVQDYLWKDKWDTIVDFQTKVFCSSFIFFVCLLKSCFGWFLLLIYIVFVLIFAIFLSIQIVLWWFIYVLLLNYVVFILFYFCDRQSNSFVRTDRGFPNRQFTKRR